MNHHSNDVKIDASTKVFVKPSCPMSVLKSMSSSRDYHTDIL